MSLQGRKVLRSAANIVLDALLHAISGHAKGGSVSIATLEAVVNNLKQSRDLDHYFDQVFQEVQAVVEEAQQDKNRTNFFGRLMLEPLSDCFDAGELERSAIPNIFSFFHLVMGDEIKILNERCSEIVNELRESLGEEFSWDAFYDNADAKSIRWRTLVRIAKSFKHWEARVDWFIKLMQYEPNTISQGSNAFIIKKKHDGQEKPHLFGQKEFKIFFTHLFKPLRELNSADEKRFEAEFGAPANSIIGTFMVRLAGMQG